MSHKRKRSIIDDLLRDFFDDLESSFDDFSGSGYSISVVQTPEGTKIRVKAGKDTDVNSLKRQLQQQYPNAEIEIEGGREEPLIKEVSTKSVVAEKEEKRNG
ncbi:hypothetical protein J7L00_07940 [Candidatus Bathyarchaeota archaeon]|nr:hypothetical protein [Candidatus Bathyarchaeota archaeon]